MFILDSDKQQAFIHPGKVSCTFELNEGQYTDIENSLLMHVTRFLLEQKEIAKRISVKNYFSCWQDSYLLLYCSLFKVPLGPEFWYSIFLHFRKSSVVVSHHAKFQLITMTGSRFFRTVFVEILRPPLLALVPEAGLRISGSDVRGSPQT